MPDPRRRALLRGCAAAGLLAAALGAQAAGRLPALDDPAAAARAAGPGEPVILLVSTRGCPHCEQVRDSYLLPRARAGAVVREIDLAGRAPVRLAGGRSEDEASFARRLGAAVAPTVVMIDGQGRALAAPLAGSDTAGFYEAYLEARLGQARERLKPAQR